VGQTLQKSWLQIYLGPRATRLRKLAGKILNDLFLCKKVFFNKEKAPKDIYWIFGCKNSGPFDLR
jgi:hypothetical protein